MKQYTVTFVQYYTYEVEAENEDEAFDSAYENFDVETHRPIANNWYDEVEINEIKK